MIARWTSANQRHELLYKAFFCQGVSDGGMVPATRVEHGRLPSGKLYAASMFQHLIRGQPARVTVVGDQVFAAAIEVVSNDVDWRPTQQLATLREIIPPAETVTKLHRYMRHFGLEYGAFDFIEDSTGTWWSLEVNPTGQYGFVEIKAGIKITSAIVDRLCLPAHRRAT